MKLNGRTNLGYLRLILQSADYLRNEGLEEIL